MSFKEGNQFGKLSKRGEGKVSIEVKMAQFLKNSNVPLDLRLIKT